jgi:hypothetical protein
MIEYKVLGKDNSPITRDNFEDASRIIKDVFPGMPVDKKDMGRTVREKYGSNGNTAIIYYGPKGTEITIQKEHEKEIIRNFELGTNLKLEGRRCL